MLRRVIGEDVRLSIVPKAPRSLVRADAGQMEQVIMNLAVNARDAMPEGGRLDGRDIATPCIDDDVAADNHEARPGPHVMLSVTDTGIGMSASVARRLFEPYFTTKAAGRRNRPRSLHRLRHRPPERRAHHGDQRGRSGKHVPRPVCRIADGARAEDRRSAAQKLPGGTEHILLIEDDASVRRLARRTCCRAWATA